MRILVGTVIVITVVLVLLALYAEHIKRSGMFFPDVYPEGEWNPGVVIRPVDYDFMTPDGVKLHGWFFRAASEDAPLLIYFHGNGGNLSHRASVASQLAERGVNVFLFDYRGYGRSQGRPSEEPIHIDSLAAYDFARATFGTPPGKIALYGESIGGPYAARVATRREACCVVVESSFPSLRRVGNTLFRPIPLGYFARDLLRTREWLDQAGLPVLVMHGRRDRVIPFHLGMELYEELRVEKELFVSETAGHAELELAEGGRFYEAITAFIRKHGSDRGGGTSASGRPRGLVARRRTSASFDK